MQTILNERLTEMYERMRNQCLADFELNGSLGSRSYALKPNMAPIRFDLRKMMLPLPLLGLHNKGHMSLKAAVNMGQIVAVFVGQYLDIDLIPNIPDHSISDRRHEIVSKKHISCF
ncbi:MAG: hypothetical protein GQ553_04465 [Nitrosomonadaceae bacterium]|nr:hypothetical protein [Nitrosomonadaceae bacterium]